MLGPFIAKGAYASFAPLQFAAGPGFFPNHHEYKNEIWTAHHPHLPPLISPKTDLTSSRNLSRIHNEYTLTTHPDHFAF